MGSIKHLGKGDIAKTSAVSAKISSIKGRAATLMTDIDEVTFHGLLHAQKHGDTTLLSNLLEAMGTSQRTGAVCAYIEAMSRGQIAASYSKGKAKVTITKGWSADKFEVEKARSVSVWDYAGDEAKPKLGLSDFYAFVFSRKAKLEAIDAGDVDFVGTPEQLQEARDFVNGALAQIGRDADGMQKLRDQDKVLKSRVDAA
jgi:hypothetical protein